MDDPWVRYYENGQLMEKGIYKDKGDYKNGKEEGPWVRYYENGQLESKGTFQNGREEK